MPSRDFEDDYADDPLSRRERRGTNWVLIGLLIGAATLLLFLVVAGVGATLFWSRQANRNAAVQAQAQANAVKAKNAAKQTFTRDDFRGRVMCKTPDQVVAAVGEPNVRIDLAGAQSWIYQGRTHSPKNEVVDDKCTLEFRDGKVALVTFDSKE